MKDPKFHTSLYNHKPIGDGVKPIISNRQFMELLKRIRAGDISAYTKAKDCFSLEPKQDKMINDIINNRYL